jgi:hypothetical protein
MCETAVIEKALKPAAGKYGARSGWPSGRNNWSQVCGSGIAIASAAIMEADPALTRELYDKGVNLVEKCHDFYRPDGMYPEGPGYWQYGTNYHVMLLATAEALGSPVKDDPILRKAGAGIMHITGPTRRAFNFSDANMKKETPSPAQCWISRHFLDATQVFFVRHLLGLALEAKNDFYGDRLLPFTILWLPPTAGDVELENAAVFQGKQSVASFRTSWDPKATWIAVKGGTSGATHGHMDVGSFVYESHGVRWFVDLGSENYNLPGYSGGKRWTYYRLQSRSHNTLEIDGKLQVPKAEPCPIKDSGTRNGKLWASFDLTNAYRNCASSVIRSVDFDPSNGNVVIRDQIDAPKGPVIWRGLTDTDIKIHGNTAVLRESGKSITLKCEHQGAEWSVGSAKPNSSKEKQNAGYKALELRIPAASKLDFQVAITP